MTKKELVHSIEAHIPECVLKVYRKTKRYLIWRSQQQANKKAVSAIRAKNGPLKVVFIVNDAAIWKYDSVYRLMQKDKAFEPLILVCPTINGMTKEQAQERLVLAYDTFYKKGYNVVKTTEDVSLPGLEVSSLQPDILFYSYAWTTIMESQYREQALCKYLKCYVNYGFSNTAGEWGYASAFHGLMWRYFAECEDVRTIAIEAQPREMQNIIVTGYPMYDEYQAASGDTFDWKNADQKYKRVIWAPHHTIEGHDGLLKFSTFLENAEEMLHVAEQYKDFLQFAFKPHPQLKAELYHHPKWGKEKTDAYYQQWANGENTTLVNGPYMDLFKSSDAMIHDCGSFIVEYLYTQKPVMYLGGGREEQSNIVGKKAYQCHYRGNTIEDVKHFLEDVVLNGKDDMKPIREQFYKDVLLPPNGCSVAENIIREIKKELIK